MGSLVGLTALSGCAGLVPEAAPTSETQASLALQDEAASRAGVDSQTKKGAKTCDSGRMVRSAFYWQGRHTASGERFNPDGLTAAHRTLPFGTRLTVTNPRTGKSVDVVVNDRGPFTHGLHLDLSRGAARAIGLNSTGTVCISQSKKPSET